MSGVPFRYAAYSHYYSPWFRRGPQMEDWQAPAPYQTIPFPPGDPYDDYPYVRRYPMLEYAAVPAYARRKDRQALGSMARYPSPSPSPPPPGYASMVPAWAHVDRTEAGAPVSVFDAEDDFGFDDDDDYDDLEDVFTLRYGAEEAKKKIRPFKAISELFKKTPSGRTKAEELVVASKRLERELKRGARRMRRAPVLVQQPPSPSGGLTTGQTAALVGGVSVVALGLGFMAANMNKRRS